MKTIEKFIIATLTMYGLFTVLWKMLFNVALSMRLGTVRAEDGMFIAFLIFSLFSGLSYCLMTSKDYKY